MANLMLGTIPLLSLGGGGINITDYLDNPVEITNYTWSQLVSLDSSHIAFGCFKSSTYYFGYIKLCITEYYDNITHYSIPTLYLYSLGNYFAQLYTIRMVNRGIAAINEMYQTVGYNSGNNKFTYPSGFTGKIYIGKFKLIIK